jgi:hypothetical protein
MLFIKVFGNIKESIFQIPKEIQINNWIKKIKTVNKKKEIHF